MPVQAGVVWLVKMIIEKEEFKKLNQLDRIEYLLNKRFIEKYFNYQESTKLSLLFLILAVVAKLLNTDSVVKIAYIAGIFFVIIASIDLIIQVIKLKKLHNNYFEVVVKKK